MKRVLAILFIVVFLFMTMPCSVSFARTNTYRNAYGKESEDYWGNILVWAVVFLVSAGILGWIALALDNKLNPRSPWGYRRKMSSAEREFAEEAHKLSNKGLDAKTSRKAEEALLQYEVAYSYTKSQTRLISDGIYQEDLEYLRDHYETLSKEEWEQRAGKLLDKFLELYLMITDPSFKDVEKAYRSKKRCIEYWQKYFASPPENVIVHPKQYIKDYLMDYYDPCMESHELLEKKLSSSIDQMKPEYKRAVKLRKDLLDIVAQSDGIMRSELLSKSFEGCTKKEIEWCYRELVKQYKLVEIKINNRYIVKLSDKERERRDKV